MKTKLYSLAAACGCLLGSFAHADVIVDETFQSGNRTTYTPPTSLKWYSANAEDTLTTQVGSMSMSTSDNFALAYFADAPISLNVGEKLTLSVVFNGTLAGVSSATGLRFGLFNSGGNRIAADEKGGKWRGDDLQQLFRICGSVWNPEHQPATLRRYLGS